jgi:hypothetical protein
VAATAEVSDAELGIDTELEDIAGLGDTPPSATATATARRRPAPGAAGARRTPRG